MSKDTIDCYVIPSAPLPMLLPLESIADVIKKPELEVLETAPAAWMKGYVNWQNQRLPVMSYSALLDNDLDESEPKKQQVVVLNAIPEAARKAYSGLLCYGEVKKVAIDTEIEFTDFPDGVDKRYVESVVIFKGHSYLIPRLSSLGVAFTYI